MSGPRVSLPYNAPDPFNNNTHNPSLPPTEKQEIPTPLTQADLHSPHTRTRIPLFTSTRTGYPPISPYIRTGHTHTPPPFPDIRSFYYAEFLVHFQTVYLILRHKKLRSNCFSELSALLRVQKARPPGYYLLMSGTTELLRGPDWQAPSVQILSMGSCLPVFVVHYCLLAVRNHYFNI